MLALILATKYFILIPIAIVEGPIIMMFSGFLIKLDVLSLWPAYFALMAGDLIGDVLWYGVGYYKGEKFIRRYGSRFGIIESDVEKVKRIFHKHKYPILFISKITMGFGFALVTLITAGLVKIPFKKYMILNVLGQFIWTGILMGVGFFLGSSYLLINSIIGKVSFIAGILIILTLGFQYIKTLRKKAIEKSI